MPAALTNVAARFVDSLKVNVISEKSWRGRDVVIKRRNPHSEHLTKLANLYFRMASLPIRFWTKTEAWQRWEVKCFRMLNGDQFRASRLRDNAIMADKLPGKSLWEYLNRGTLTRHVMEAAGREFRRAHQFWSDEFRNPWSHGDAGMANVIYDEKADRARLIDFEIVHDKSLPVRSRHADDLLIFLLDLVAVAPARQWLPLALSFLNAYDNAPAIARLTNQLTPPSNMAWIWWGVRTSFSNPAKVKRRLAKLRDLAANLGYYRAFAAKRARQRRRASISCHEISPGMPRPISRARATSARAKAPSPEMPSKWPTAR
jgi:tRNA A-37 threonylcarbamoyl transferase component Bud32